MHAVTGDETGLIKLVNIKRKTIVSRCGEQSRKNGVSQLTWLFGSSTQLVSLSKSGVVRVWDTLTEASSLTCVGGGEDGVLLASLPSSFLTGSKSGNFKCFPSCAEDANKAIIREFSVGKPVDCARFHAAAGIIAVGGNECDVTLFDAETATQTFQARNVPHTKLDLRVPVWVSAIQFLPDVGAAQVADAAGTSAGRVGASPHMIAAVSRHRHVRLYDVRADRRPVHSVEVGDFALTAVEVTNDGRSLLVGDSAGSLRRLDISAGLRESAVYKGIGGCVRAIAVSSVQPYVATAGLDRCLHVHHVETRERLRRVYLKQCLTAMQLVPDARASIDDVSTVLAPEPPRDTRVRITYIRGVAPPAAPAEDDDGDAVWEELDRRAAAAATPADTAAPRGAAVLAGKKHARNTTHSDEELSAGYDDMTDGEIEKLDGGVSGPDSDDDGDGDLDNDSSGSGVQLKPRRSVTRHEELTASAGESGGSNGDDSDEDDDNEEEEDDDDPLVSSLAAAKSLRRDVEAVKRAEARHGVSSGATAARTRGQQQPSRATQSSRQSLRRK